VLPDASGETVTDLVTFAGIYSALAKMAAPGQLAYLTANLKLLNESHYELKRFDEDSAFAVSLTVFRPRPIKASRPSTPAVAGQQ
jgi:hypothetical protein